MVRVLIACEFSGIVRDAFIRKGHDAISCDLLPTEQPGPHYQGDVFDIIDDDWGLMIAHPPCTHLASSGALHWHRKQQEQEEALEFVRRILKAPISRIALENPIGRISTSIRKPDQIIHPWQFGHGESKTTCLWLKGLPKLTSTDIVDGRHSKILALSPGPNRWKDRSRTYEGIANAMADQWGKTLHYHCIDGCEKSAGEGQVELFCVKCGAPFIECNPEICPEIPPDS